MNIVPFYSNAYIALGVAYGRQSKLKEDHYRRWVDMPIGSLGGMTPGKHQKQNRVERSLRKSLKLWRML